MCHFMRSVILSFLSILLMTSIGVAAPTIKVLPSSQSIEKGGVYQIKVEMSTNEPIRDIPYSTYCSRRFYFGADGFSGRGGL